MNNLETHPIIIVSYILKYNVLNLNLGIRVFDEYHKEWMSQRHAYIVVNRSNVDRNTIFETLEINNVVATINDWYQNSDRIDMND